MTTKRITVDDLSELLDIAEDFQLRGKPETASFLIGLATRIREELNPVLAGA